MNIRIPMFGGHLEIGMTTVTEIDLSSLGEETLAKIEASRKGEETFESAAKRLLLSGMMTEAYRLAGADIVKKDSNGQETVIFPAEK